MKKLLLIITCVTNVAFAQNPGVYDNRVENPYVFCSSPKPSSQPWQGIYDRLCKQAQQQSAIYGHCGQALNSCATGKFVDVADNPYLNVWVCQGYNEQGQPHGNYSESCSTKKDVPIPAPVPVPVVNDPYQNQPVVEPVYVTPIYGHCGPTLNSCATGKFVDVADNAYNHVWVCQGYDSQGQPHGNYSESCSVGK